MEFNFPFDDITFSFSPKDFEKGNLQLIDDGVYVSQDEIQFSMDNFAAFKVTNGDTIEFFPYVENYDKALLELYVNGPILGAILHQRKILPLHASSIVYQEKGILFCGESGAGKSTTALVFMQSGASILADDVSPVLVEREQIFALGYSSKLKLWEDTFQKLAIQKTTQQKIWTEDEREKFYHPLESQKTKQKIHFLFFLKIGNNLGFKKVKGIEKFEKLHQHIFRNEFITLMPETQKSYIQQIKEICAHCELIEIKRPKEIHPIVLKDFLLSLMND